MHKAADRGGHPRPRSTPTLVHIGFLLKMTNGERNHMGALPEEFIMSEYLFTGRNPDGKQVTECIEADCADAAVRHLTERGYQDIVLHTDDVGARYTHQKRVARHISPREYIRFRSMGRSGYFFFMLAKAYKASWLALLLAIALLAFRWQSGRPFGPVDMVALSIFVLPLLLALIAAVVRYGGRYERLVEAASWARWQEVLRLLPGLPAGISADEKAFR